MHCSYTTPGPLFGNPLHTHFHAQVNQLLEVGDRSQGTKKYSAMAKWSSQLKAIHTTVLSRLS